MLFAAIGRTTQTNNKFGLDASGRVLTHDSGVNFDPDARVLLGLAHQQHLLTEHPLVLGHVLTRHPQTPWEKRRERRGGGERGGGEREREGEEREGEREDNKREGESKEDNRRKERKD